MPPFKPYTYIQCPCTDHGPPSYQLPISTTPKNEAPNPNTSDTNEEGDEGQTFDPRAPRANYSLYPLEHLLYCEDCHQIRCPKCVLDEIVTWYCPNCLFEVPSSTVKSEGNRCTRSCFQCPLCTSPLTVSSVEAPPTGLGAEYASQSGPYVLNCGFCTWSSREIGIQFDKPNGIYSQLSKIKNGGEAMITPRERRKERKREISDSALGEDGPGEFDPHERLDVESQFANLKAFYQAQLADSSPINALGFSADYGYSSPGALSRIMGLYTGSSSFGAQKAKARNGVMREAADATEGLQLFSPSEEEDIITKLRTEGWENTPTLTQRSEQLLPPGKSVDDLRPIPNLLRTKRSKRCKTCRHILSKPESKITATRFRIRLVAHNYLPSITITALSPPPLQATSASSSSIPQSLQLLSPLKPVQFLLTFKNPLFDPIRVSIATPSKTPGRFASDVAILCPQFEVGANTDAWDEALGSGAGSKGDRKRGKGTGDADVSGSGSGSAAAEAGKVWERGRNWCRVVVEVVPASLRHASLLLNAAGWRKDEEGELVIGEDEDVLEIPVFVRVEWEADVAGEEGGAAAATATGGGKGEKEKRELAYWCVLGVGRIAPT